MNINSNIFYPHSDSVISGNSTTCFQTNKSNLVSLSDYDAHTWECVRLEHGQKGGFLLSYILKSAGFGKSISFLPFYLRLFHLEMGWNR